MTLPKKPPNLQELADNFAKTLPGRPPKTPTEVFEVMGINYYKGQLIPNHLLPFWRLLTELIKDKWFEKVEKIAIENKDNLPKWACKYAQSLLRLVLKEENIQKKYDYYQALSKFLDFLGGQLGNAK